MTLCPRRWIARAAAATLCAICIDSPARGQDTDPLKIPDTQLEPLKWSDLDRWAGDDHAAAFKTFLTSCKPLLHRKQSERDERPIVGGLQDACKRAVAAGPLSADKARAFFEDNFRPVRIARLGESQGLLTGYYEPIVEGSRFPNPEFYTPLYRRPPDLVAAGRPKASAGFPNRGNIGRRNGKGELEPYHDRAAIEDGALDGQKLEICWLKDPFDAFSIQIQGSARVKLEDGLTLRVNYAAHNGHSYSSVGRALIERDLVPRDQMSMQRIREWMKANPDEARQVRQTNRSFVFFRITGLSDDEEATGAQGVPLTPGRSIAVDRTHVYGTLFFIESELPIKSHRPTTKFRRLMVAQDTGSAIVGPARADLYWGAGDEAGRIAGRIRQQGRFAILIPRELDIVEAGKRMPLPRVKPPIPKPAKAKAPAGKGKADDAKDKTLDAKEKPDQAGDKTSDTKDAPKATKDKADKAAGSAVTPPSKSQTEAEVALPPAKPKSKP